MPVRAALFDLDGTLIDSLDDIAAALAAALADHGIAAPARDDVRGWIGDGAPALVERALAAAGAAAAPAAVLAAFRARYAAAPVARTRVYPGLPAALDALAAAGVALGILSNKPHDLTVAIAGALLARWPFAAVAGARPGVPLKPDPTAALELAAALGVPASACAYVGDSPVDVATARAAGMRAIAVGWGLRPRAELARARPDAVVDDPQDLVGAIAS